MHPAAGTASTETGSMIDGVLEDHVLDTLSQPNRNEGSVRPSSDVFSASYTSSLRCVRNILHDAASVLSADKSQLRGKLFTRLFLNDDANVQRLVKQLQTAKGPWLHSMLTQPVWPPLQFSPRGRHSESINARGHNNNRKSRRLWFR